jgi:hypothetical protein
MVAVVPFNGFNCKCHTTINFYNERIGLKTKVQEKSIKMLDKVKHAHFSQAHTYIYAFIHPHILMKFAPFFTQQEKKYTLHMM